MEDKGNFESKPGLAQGQGPGEGTSAAKPVRVCRVRSGKLTMIKRIEWPDTMGEMVHGKNIIFEDSYGFDWAVVLNEGALGEAETEYRDYDEPDAGKQEPQRRGAPRAATKEEDELEELTDEDRMEIAIRGLEGRALRYADDEDNANIEHLAELETEAMNICIDRIKAHKLPMKLLATDFRYDRSKVTFHFSAENRVDFRQLVRDLASIFKCRIELHQIGIRDEAKLYPGHGPCGEKQCCQRHLTRFASVSIRMARLQNLPLNPAKISGNCGRLMCCLNYECETYDELAKILPRVGDERDIDAHRCVVVFVSPLTETITVHYKDEPNKKFSVTMKEYDEGHTAKKHFKSG